jgi:hypothetical protein
VDLVSLARSGPEAVLREDPAASLAAIAADVAIYGIVKGMGIAPVALAGYGAGFHAAAVAAGVLPLRAALALAAEEQRLGWEALGGREYLLASIEGTTGAVLEEQIVILRSEAVALAQGTATRCLLAGEVALVRAALDDRADRGSHRDPASPPRQSYTRDAEVPWAHLGVPARPDGRIRGAVLNFDGSIVLRGWQVRT